MRRAELHRPDRAHAGRVRGRSQRLGAVRGQPGHEVEDVETVVERKDGYWVVRQSDAHAWTEVNGGSKPLRQYSAKELRAIAEGLRRWRVTPAGTEGYGKAEVTAGGVDTAELSSQTMEARRVPGLYFIGEVVDVTGHLGGFNFQWAWASGFAAAQAV